MASTGLKSTISEAIGSYEPYTPTSDELAIFKEMKAFRLKMRPPPQSGFRVVAALRFYELSDEGNVQHVIGCNAEPGSVGGAICGERNALLQLCARYPLRDFAVTDVLLTTDHCEPKACGALCLEFLCAMATPTTRVLSTGAEMTTFAWQLLRKMYPFPSLHKYVPIPTHAKLREFSKEIVSQSMESMPSEWKAVYKRTREKAEAKATELRVCGELVHPCVVSASALLADGSELHATGFVTIEYGATVNASSLLVKALKHLSGAELSSAVLLICDNYGLLHAPTAAMRQVLFENGLCDLSVAVMYHSATDPPLFYQNDFHHHFAFESGPSVTHLMALKKLTFKMFLATVRELLPAPCGVDMLESTPGLESDSSEEIRPVIAVEHEEKSEPTEDHAEGDE